MSFGKRIIKNVIKSEVKKEVKKETQKQIKKLMVKACSETMEMKHINNYEDFKEAYDKEGKEPRKAVFFYLIGVLEYVTGNPEEGEPMITITLPKDYNQADPNSPSGFKLHKGGEGRFVEYMAEKPNIIKSFLGGTNKNNYAIDEDHLKMLVVGKYISDKNAVIDIQSGGKDFYTRVMLKKNKEGYWKLFGTSSIATGVKKPQAEMDDF